MRAFFYPFIILYKAIYSYNPLFIVYENQNK
jgi:hypothetical protein